jgi:hypothetical protein
MRKRTIAIQAGLILALIGAGMGIIRAQPADPPAVLVWTPPLPADQAAWVNSLAAALEALLPGATVERITASRPPDRETPLIVWITPCVESACDLRLVFSPLPPAGSTLLTADLERAILASSPWSLDLTFAAQPPNRERLARIGSALAAYASGDCASALPAFEAARLDNSAPLLAFYHALCLRQNHDYPAALDILAGEARLALARGGAPQTVRRLWEAYLADSLAQDFAFDRAIAWDSQAIVRTAALLADAPLGDRLRAELTLQRGRHRLYLYEWNAALADFNAALAMPGVPPRAYYDRGMLYYTQNEREAARADLARYLALETDRQSRLIAPTQAMLDELDRLLATPAAPGTAWMPWQAAGRANALT